jgi:hypothetical protein
MSSPFIHIADVLAFEEQVLASHTCPTVLSEHDTWCWVSTAAPEDAATAPWPVALVDIGRHLVLSHLIAERKGVPNESPPVLALRGGVAVRFNSDRAITAAAVAAALQQPPAVHHAGSVEGVRLMAECTYKQEEIVGVSDVSSDDAIRNAIAGASQTLRGSTGSRWSRRAAGSRTAVSPSSR